MASTAAPAVRGRGNNAIAAVALQASARDLEPLPGLALSDATGDATESPA